MSYHRNPILLSAVQSFWSWYALYQKSNQMIWTYQPRTSTGKEPFSMKFLLTSSKSFSLRLLSATSGLFGCQEVLGKGKKLNLELSNYYSNFSGSQISKHSTIFSCSMQTNGALYIILIQWMPGPFQAWTKLMTFENLKWKDNLPFQVSSEVPCKYFECSSTPFLMPLKQLIHAETT